MGAGYGVVFSEAAVALANPPSPPQSSWPASWASGDRVEELSYARLVAYASRRPA
jgi:hypothetical protein